MIDHRTSNPISVWISRCIIESKVHCRGCGFLVSGTRQCVLLYYLCQIHHGACNDIRYQKALGSFCQQPQIHSGERFFMSRGNSKCVGLDKSGTSVSNWAYYKTLMELLGSAFRLAISCTRIVWFISIIYIFCTSITSARLLISQLGPLSLAHDTCLLPRLSRSSLSCDS